MTKLFVGGISYTVNNQQLEELFQKYGNVSSVNIINDKFTGQSKGFAFIEMEDDSQAQEAIKQLDGFALEGRQIGVSVAKPKVESNDRNSNNRNRGNFQRNRGNSNWDNNKKRY